ncbi:MAG: heme o synthase [Chthoniobacterales bacterium]
METTALDPDHEASPSASAIRSSPLGDFAELIKARLTLLVLLTTAVGYYMGAPPTIDVRGLLHVFLGTSLAAAGAAALNQWWERRLDGLMNRTKLRPLPAGRMSAIGALTVGILLSAAGVAYLAWACNRLTALLAFLTVALYILAYTPLKRISTANTLIGAIPGAIPPLIGWAAARGELGVGAWSLFAIMFFWQMPHFFAIAWLYRVDYARAGFRMVSNDDDSGARSSSQSVLFCILLLMISGLPTNLGLTTSVYLAFALALGGFYTAMALRFHNRRTARDARNLFLSSIIYLPLLLAALVLTKI